MDDLFFWGSLVPVPVQGRGIFPHCPRTRSSRKTPWFTFFAMIAIFRLENVYLSIMRGQMHSVGRPDP